MCRLTIRHQRQARKRSFKSQRSSKSQTIFISQRSVGTRIHFMIGDNIGAEAHQFIPANSPRTSVTVLGELLFPMSCT